jgi:endoglucanase
MTKAGRVLVSGSWANHPPYAYSPSYTSPAANALLADATGDKRWAQLDSGTRAVTTAMLNSADLPPDWAQFILMAASTPCPVRPGAERAVRLRRHPDADPLRESCHPADVALAARLTPALDRFVGNRATRDLGGAAPLCSARSLSSRRQPKLPHWLPLARLLAPPPSC